MSNRISFGTLRLQGLDNVAGGSNMITQKNIAGLRSSTAISDHNFYAFLGADIGRMGVSSQAFKIGDYTSWSAINMGANNQSDPVIISAFGAHGSRSSGQLTNAITFDANCGFGIRSSTEWFRGGSFVNSGESLTFAVTGGKSLQKVEFVAKSDPWAFFHSKSKIVLDVDGDVFAAGNHASAWSGPASRAAVTLDVAKGAKIVIDFEKKILTVNGSAQRGAQIDNFFKAAASAPDKVTIGSAGGAAFAIDDLIIDRADAPLTRDANGRVTVDKMIHDDAGMVSLSDGSKVFFQGTNEKGQFVYGDKLVDNRRPSYDLTKEDATFLLKQAKLGVVAANKLVDKSDARGIRELTGEGNNKENPTWGEASTRFERLVDKNIYDDKTGTMPNTGPLPRDISNAILNQSTSGNVNLIGVNAGDQDRKQLNNFGGNELFTAFGQYYDHGLDFLVKGGTNADGTRAGTVDPLGSIGNIQLPPLTRGSVDKGTGINGIAREHINATAQYVDQNQTYGSNNAILEFLLARDSAGKLTAKLLEGKDGGLPTLDELIANWKRGSDAGLVPKFDMAWVENFRGSGEPLLIDINRGIPLGAHFVAGDGRVNENLGLTAVHTIWAKNHNYWADYLVSNASKLGLPAQMSQLEIFNMAKIINEAEYQRAVFDEFTELMVGSNVHAFLDYNPNVNATITHEFAGAAFRLGHSMLNNHITVQKPDGTTVEMPLFTAFLAPDKIKDFGGAKGIVAGMVTGLHEEIDAQMVTTMRNNLVGRPLDLASFNIARGRDLGLPTLNEMREMAGLKRYQNWDDFAANLRFPSDVEKFKSVYKNVNEVELWVGGLAEKPKSANGLGNDTVLGETFTFVFSITQIGLQDGDRFYYKHRLFETNLRQEIQTQDFSSIIERTLGLEYMHAEVFTTAKKLDLSGVSQKQLVLEGTNAIEIIIGRDIGETIYGAGAQGRGHIVDRQAFINQQLRVDATAVEPPEGPAPANKRQVDGDTIYAKAGDDVVIAGDTDDALYGGSGNDILVGNDGDDRFDGGDGNDHIFAGLGDDDMAGNAGDDIMFGGLGDDEAFGGAGNDQIFGGDGDDNLWGGDGNDLVEGGRGNDFISGGEGTDVLNGGDGDDRVLGGGGNDVMTGGAGRDTFQFLPASGRDVIRDFSVAEDRIDLHRYKWDALEKGQTFGLDQLVFKNVSGGVEISGKAGSVFANQTITLSNVSASTLQANASKIFIFEDVVNARDGLILSADGLVIGAAGAGNMALAVPPPPPPVTTALAEILPQAHDGISIHI